MIRGRIPMKHMAIAALASAAVLSAGAAQAQAPDFSIVEIKTTDLGNKTYMLEGQGGNITVAVGTDGIIMVDTQFAPLHDKIKAAIAKISPLPVKYVINTHYHGDHVDGNALFHKAGATIVAHDNLRIRMAAGTTNLLTGNKVPPAAAEAIPTMTYQVGDMKVQVGGRTAELKHVINAHTDGDTWVYFADGNVLALGDTFTNSRYPNIDWSNGGGIDGMILANSVISRRRTTKPRSCRAKARPPPRRTCGRSAPCWLRRAIGLRSCTTRARARRTCWRPIRLLISTRSGPNRRALRAGQTSCATCITRSAIITERNPVSWCRRAAHPCPQPRRSP